MKQLSVIYKKIRVTHFWATLLLYQKLVGVVKRVVN
nr:MAG TPA: hypothetical protein [Caudoviricetes sp.]